MEPLKENFDAAGNAPGAWWLAGQNLLVTADVLRQQCPVDLSSVINHNELEKAIALSGRVLMLRAFGFECFLKMLYLDRGGMLADDGSFLGVEGVSKQHDLVALARAAQFKVSPDEEYFFAYLTIWNSLGRYPIQRYWRTNMVADRYGRKRDVNWSAEDEGSFDKLRTRFREEHKRLSAKFSAQ